MDDRPIQTFSRVLSFEDGLLLIHEGLTTDPAGHRLQSRGDRADHMIAMNKISEHPRCDTHEASMCERRQACATGRSPLRRITARAGIDEHKTRHAFSCLPHDFERHVAAH